jgi:HD-like signal output (HDOD) protein
MGKVIAFPCPDCKATISLDLSQKSSRDDTKSAEKGQKELLTGEALKRRIVETVKDLPPMPQTVVKAREIMADPKAGFKDLADLFEADQAIAASILKMANSTYYGMRGQVSSIQRASVVLGHKTLGELITMSGAASLLGERLEGYALDAGDLWKHCLAVAFGSRIVAEKTDPELENDAFTTGLLHDSGKLILDKYISERWELFEDFMADGQRTFLDAEKEILELDHPEIASEVCKSWNIPQNLAVSIRYHHRPSQSQGNKLAYIVHVADATAMMTGLGIGIDGTLYQMEEGAMEYLGLGEEDLSEIMGGVIDASTKISES